jgi:hypothetical protein
MTPDQNQTKKAIIAFSSSASIGLYRYHYRFLGTLFKQILPSNLVADYLILSK